MRFARRRCSCSAPHHIVQLQAELEAQLVKLVIACNAKAKEKTSASGRAMPHVAVSRGNGSAAVDR